MASTSGGASSSSQPSRGPPPAPAHQAFTLETALHVAVGSGQASDSVKKLVQEMSDEDLSLGDMLGHNALHIAALTGNTDAARILVERLPALVHGHSHKRWLPIHVAAGSAHRDTLDFLMSLYYGSNDVLLLCLVIDAGFYDIALLLVKKYPHLARMKHGVSDSSGLERLSKRNLAFPSGTRFNFWERLILIHRILIHRMNQLKRESEPTPQSSDTESQSANRVSEDPTAFVGDYKRLKWKSLARYVLSGEANPRTTAIVVVIFLMRLPCDLVHIVAVHEQAIQLVKCLCENMESSSHAEQVTSIYNAAMMTAARLGVYEVVQEIVKTFPDVVHARKGHYFQVAAENRSEKVFNLIYQTKGHKHLYSDSTDSRGNNILHLVAKLAPPHKLNLVSGAALQMQRELQWFKEVEKFVQPYAREQENDDGKTAKMIFTEEHKSLKAEGEKWMKDTANSYIIVAALIATVVFAAAITVPGGNNSNTGYPMFTESSAFIVFAISDVGSLFTSITSLLMFLSIMTSRYAEKDFLYALPKRLCIGLFTLFVSILFMMVAFSASTYLVLGQGHKWVLIPVAALASLPIASFVLLQFPLLWDVISLTYGRNIFGKQTYHIPEMDVVELRGHHRFKHFMKILFC